MITIYNADDKRVELYRHLHGTPQSHTETRVFIAEGTKTTRALLKSDLKIVSVFALPEFYEEYSELIKRRNIPQEQLFASDKTVMNDIVGFRLHEGVMAIGVQPSSVLIEEIKFPAVALIGIVNSENVGAIIRNCAAFGVKSVIVDAATSSPYLRRAVRVSMGAVFSLNIHFEKNIQKVLSILRNDSGVSIISAELTDYSKNIHGFEFPKKSVILFGSEGKGIARDILEMSESVISIPIETEIDSLNVAAASAIILYELRKYEANLKQI
ncbi:MAG: RNA methyltransferase [Bacteroidetes bacterium]|nr:RNA methyltransferase [Bacteroidota bacterium]